MFRTAFDLKLAAPEVSNACKVTTQQTSAGVSLLCGEARPYLAGALPGQRMCLCPVSHEGPHPHLTATGGALSGGLKPLTTHPSTAAPSGHDASAFYAPLFRGFPLRTETLSTLASPGQRMPFDPGMTSHPYGLLYAGLDVNGLGMRKAATRETTGPLKAWLHEHRKNPYPTKAEKIMLAIITKMTLTQVSTWFANARRRLKKESRLYAVKDASHEEDDHAQRQKGDDEDVNETDEECGILCGGSDSDEDVDVDGDVSDLSDDEEVSVTPAVTCPSTFSILSKPDPSSSSPNTSFPSSPLLASSGFPFLLYTSGISPAMGLHAVANGVVHSNGSEHSTFSQTLTQTAAGQSATPPGAAASMTSTTAPVEPSPRPKIWSISEIIHSDHDSASSSASARPSPSDRNSDRTNGKSASPGPPHTRRAADDQKCEISLNDLSAISSSSKGRQASRLLSVPLRLRSRPSEWLATPRPKKTRTSPPDVNQLPERDITPHRHHPGAPFRMYSASGSDVCPQTEALDLQTKKNSNDIKQGT